MTDPTPGPSQGLEFCAPQAPVTTMVLQANTSGLDVLNSVCCLNSVYPQTYDNCIAQKSVLAGGFCLLYIWGSLQLLAGFSTIAEHAYAQHMIPYDIINGRCACYAEYM